MADHSWGNYNCDQPYRLWEVGTCRMCRVTQRMEVRIAPLDTTGSGLLQTDDSHWDPSSSIPVSLLRLVSLLPDEECLNDKLYFVVKVSTTRRGRAVFSFVFSRNLQVVNQTMAHLGTLSHPSWTGSDFLAQCREPGKLVAPSSAAQQDVPIEYNTGDSGSYPYCDIA